MNSSMAAAPLRTAVVPAHAAHSATVVFLHGLGDSGMGWKPVGEMLSPLLPHVKWIFPHAPERPVTINGNARMPAWYNIYGFDPTDEQDEQGILQSVSQVESLVQEEIKAGIPSSRIILGGFSQGSVVALVANAISDIQYAGFVGLSGYLALHEKLPSMLKSTNVATPIFMAHGARDPLISPEWAEVSANVIKHRLKRNVSFRMYPDVAHSTSSKEINEIAEFITKLVPKL